MHTLITSRDSLILNELFILARDVQPVSRSRVVAALVRRKKILAIGINSYTSCFLARKYSLDVHRCYTHAEISCILNYIKFYGTDFSRCTLYVCRAKKIGGKWVTGLAKPCKACQRAIADFNIRKVVWSHERLPENYKHQEGSKMF